MNGQASPQIQSVKIVGAGLIGTSIALALAHQGVFVSIDDADKKALALAKDLLAPYLKAEGKESTEFDLVIIATPPASVVSALRAEFAKNSKSIFIDVSSVKTNLIQEIKTLPALAEQFVGACQGTAGFPGFSSALHPQGTLALLLAASAMVILHTEQGFAIASYAWAKLRGGYNVDDRIRMHATDVEGRLKPKFDAAGVSYPPAELAYITLKDKAQLEVYARNDRLEDWRHVLTYPILGMSGTTGPKLREGDMQVPEGIYRADFL
ncbi:MAG: prephenate dehydrogenase/arogenate dehydrogenase family protein, partial [Actinobacteria bacterium]|nr:prephenate dehydrogenase/arogenate dehydrogenase family protein [Actinomycetota bacterium]